MSNVFKRAWPQLVLLLAALAGVFMLTSAQQPHAQAPAVLTSGVIATGVSSPHPCGTQYATKRGYLTHHIPYFKGMLTSNTCGYVFRVKLEWTKADHQTVLGRHHSRWVAHRQIWRQVNGGTGTYLGKGWVQWSTCASGCQIGSYRVFNLERPPVVTAYQVPG